LKQKIIRLSFLQKQKKNRVLVWAVLLMSPLWSAHYFANNVVKMKPVTLASSDGLEITADEYLIDSANPYIVLFHEQESSRGEFHTIARRLSKMDYNCLAVDLRNGGNSSFVSNETARRCRETRCNTGPDDILLDMEAGINYAFEQSGQPVILLGSGANGSLSLKLANENDHVRAVIALSPGEYFLPNINIHDTIASLKKPIFITSSLAEFPYMEQLASGVDEQYVTLYEPKLGEGGRGTESLTAENEYNSEYWLALLLFFKDLL